MPVGGTASLSLRPPQLSSGLGIVLRHPAAPAVSQIRRLRRCSEQEILLAGGAPALLSRTLISPAMTQALMERGVCACFTVLCVCACVFIVCVCVCVCG